MSADEPGLVVARGARAAEAFLLGAVRDRLDSGPRDLGRPVRVVVPSAGLREHVCAALVRSAGHALLGVRVQTLGGLARELCERAGDRLTDAELLLPVLIRRRLAREPALGVLAGLRDADAVVAASVRDLLDAGLDEATADPLLETCGGAVRLRALVALALRVRRDLRERGFATEGDRYARTAERLRGEGPDLLPSRALLVYGFADVTGRAGALLEALMRVCGARVVIDHPPDPLDPGREDPSVRFTERLRARLSARPYPAGPVASAPAIRFVRTAGTDAEVRAIAARIRRELDAGTSPERIGVLARDLEPYARALRTQFTRLGIPFSARKAAGPPLPAARRLRSLASALRLRGALDVDAWLELLGAREGGPGQANAGPDELRLGLHTLGALTLFDAARLDLEPVIAEGGRLRLPLVRGVVDGEDEEPGAPRVMRASLARSELELARARAVSTLAALEAWPEGAPAEHAEALLRLVDGVLRWPPSDPARQLLDPALARLRHELPADLALGREELALALAPLLDELARSRFGGLGGGVQVLEVMEARAHTFDALFVLGLNRGRFPRVILEDALIPEAWRAAGRQALPELPRKAEGHLEERYLYAQLCAASPRVSLSFQSVDDEGRELARSPLIERQLCAPGAPEPENEPALRARDPEAMLPLFEHATHAALRDDRPSLERALIAAAEERGTAPAAARARARARLAVLEEADPRDPRVPPGPYFGWVGPVRSKGDPRAVPLYVTRLEALAQCPWRMFLSRVLRLEAPPDALDLLPRLQGRALGKAVHRALERIVGAPLGDAARTLDEALARDPVDVTWPDEEACESLLLEACEQVVRAEGIALPGLERALAELARPYLARARSALWGERGRLRALGVEVEGELRARNAAPAVRFKADLIEARDDALRIWDYKTGAFVDPFRPGTPPEARRAQLLRAVESGAYLQAAAYASASARRPARGGYLFLGAAFGSEGEVDCDADDTALAAKLDETLGLLGRALEQGVFFPRFVLASGGEPRRCGWCEFQAACLRGDSAARRRLRGWLAREPGARGPRDGAGASAQERTFRALHRGGVQGR